MFMRRVVTAIALIMKAVRTSGMSVNFNMTTRRYIPENSKLLTSRRENLKHHIRSFIFGENYVKYMNYIAIRSFMFNKKLSR
jgi:hypothetical protein